MVPLSCSWPDVSGVCPDASFVEGKGEDGRSEVFGTLDVTVHLCDEGGGPGQGSSLEFTDKWQAGHEPSKFMAKIVHVCVLGSSLDSNM